MDDKEAFYSKLNDSLNATTKFPAEYLYKFIVPTDKNQVEKVKSLFAKKSAKIAAKTSKTGKYISISVSVKLKSSKEVIYYYRQAENIEGIISL